MPRKTARFGHFRGSVLAIAVFALTATAAATALDRMDNLAALILIAPGYLVQAWLFVRHRALGGLGYDVTIVVVSALFWTTLVVGAFVACEYLVHRFSHRSES